VTIGTSTENISNVTIKNNIVYSNTWRWDLLDQSGIHSFGSTVTNLIIQDNDVYDNGDALPDFKSPTVSKSTANGIYADTIGSGLIIRRNKIHNNNQNGIGIEYTDGATAYYNISYSNGLAGLSIYRLCHNNALYNNVSYGNLYGLAVWDGSGAAGGLTGNVVKNNIAFSNTYALVDRFGGENDGTNGSGNVYTYNALGPEATNFIEWGNGVYESTYAAWETATGNCGTTGRSHSVQVDPAFVNASASQFWLAKNSPAIDAGTHLGSPYNIGLLPASSWPNSVFSGDQDSYGTGWEVGAYIFTGQTVQGVLSGGPRIGMLVIVK
jgi:hypothetical protein